MKLLPSLKQKKRYIVFEIQSKETFTASEVGKKLEATLLLFLGQLGLSKALPLYIKEKYKNNKFILKVSNNYVDECRSAVILIKKIKNKPVLLRSIITSGTLKKASSYL